MALEQGDLHPDPVRQFAAWYATASVAHPEEVAVATATPDGRPSVRMALLRGYGQRGFVFYTDRSSRKGRELQINPRAALAFHWDERQVRVEGIAAPVSDEESDAYWRGRPLESRYSALASHQSQPVTDRTELEDAVARLRAKYGDDPPRPQRWGGVRITADAYEFWQRGPNRLHDRFRYEQAVGGWRLQRLAP